MCFLPSSNSQQIKKFLRDVKSYQWDDPLLFKRYADQVIRRCVPQEEYDEILTKCHSSPYGEHFGGERIAQSCYNVDSFGPLYSKIAIRLCNNVIHVKELATSLGEMRSH